MPEAQKLLRHAEIVALEFGMKTHAGKHRGHKHALPELRGHISGLQIRRDDDLRWGESELPALSSGSRLALRQALPAGGCLDKRLMPEIICRRLICGGRMVRGYQQHQRRIHDLQLFQPRSLRRKFLISDDQVQLAVQEKLV